MDETEWIAPGLLTALHQVRNPRKFVELSKDMKQRGWAGRPLLVIQSGESYIAWTGSHRLAAAVAADMEAVPCYVVDESLLPHGVSARLGHVDDSDRLRAICKTEDETAIRIMWLEGRD